MISLLQNEIVKKSFDVKKSKKGKGVFHVTNYRIIFETLKDGVYLSIDWNHLRSVHAKKKILTKNSDTVLVVWDDDNARRWRFDLKFSVPAHQVVCEIEGANSTWSSGSHESKEDLETRKMFEDALMEEKKECSESMIPKQESKKIREDREKFFKLYLAETENKHQEFIDSHETFPSDLRKEIEQRRKIVDAAKTNVKAIKTMPLLRDPRIPSHVPDEHCWNDCYYDEIWKGYVTFRENWMDTGKSYFESEINDKFQKEINNGGLLISEDKILFNMGYPAILNLQRHPIPLATIPKLQKLMDSCYDMGFVEKKFLDTFCT